MNHDEIEKLFEESGRVIQEFIYKKEEEQRQEIKHYHEEEFRMGLL